MKKSKEQQYNQSKTTLSKRVAELERRNREEEKKFESMKHKFEQSNQEKEQYKRELDNYKQKIKMNAIQEVKSMKNGSIHDESMSPSIVPTSKSPKQLQPINIPQQEK